MQISGIKERKFEYKAKEILISTDFDNGALGKIKEKEINVFDCWPYEDKEYKYLFPGPDQQACFCFHFRLDGCKDKKIKFLFHIWERGKEKDTSIVYANPDFPVYSYDGKNWERINNKSLVNDSEVKDGKIIVVEQKFKKDRAWISYQYPYTSTHLNDYIKIIKDSPFCKIEIAGYSTKRREIKQISITDFGIPLKKKKIAWFTGLQHPAELGAGWGLEGMIDFLLSENIVAKEARERYMFKIIPIVNVDSVYEGRGNIHSSLKNLNREWEKPDPVSEVKSIKKTLDEWKAQGNPIDIFIDFHGFSVKEDESWYLVVLPEKIYKDEKQRNEYKRLIKVIKKYIPFARSGPHPSIGFAAGAGYRQYGALSMSIDGYVYRWPIKGKSPDLSSYYNLGSKIWGLKDIKACGAEFIKALVQFSKEGR